MLTLTPKAVQQFQEVLGSSGNEGRSIRISLVGSGCCGTSAGIDLVEQGEPDDLALEWGGLHVYLERRAAAALDAAIIDFSADGPDRGFTIDIPASGGCCG